MSNIESVLTNLQKYQYLFLTGGAGVGKTTLTRQVIARYESEGKKVAKLASTGMAATLIAGQTLHSFFDLGICDSVDDLEAKRKYNIKKKIKKLILSMSLIIIDEVSMVSAELFDMIALRLMQAGYEGELLCVGDFLQLPPVVRGYQSVHFAFESESWQGYSFKIMNLTEIYRTDDEDFIKVLAKVRFGEIGEAEHSYLHYLIRPLPNDFKHYTYLFGKNTSANAHNLRELSLVEDEPFMYETQVIKHNSKIEEREVERFLNDARVQKVLELKVGVPVLFTRNSWNYYNGERGEIVKLTQENVYVQKVDASVVKLDRVKLSKTEFVEKLVEGKKEFVEVERLSLNQFPLQLAYAITIHKSQGMSIQDLIIDTSEIFAPSQFYVALSRATTPSRLILTQPKVNWKYLAFVDERAVKFVKEQCLNNMDEGE